VRGRCTKSQPSIRNAPMYKAAIQRPQRRRSPCPASKAPEFSNLASWERIAVSSRHDPFGVGSASSSSKTGFQPLAGQIRVMRVLRQFDAGLAQLLVRTRRPSAIRAEPLAEFASVRRRLRRACRTSKPPCRMPYLALANAPTADFSFPAEAPAAAFSMK
jgi:hypothetical protein